MCRSQKEIISSDELEISSKSLPPNPSHMAPTLSRVQIGSNQSDSQIPDDRAEVIRSNKNLLKRNLRNSLQMQRTVSLLSNKQQDLTAASLKDLGSDKHLSFKKVPSENADSFSGSSKFVIAETEKIIEEAFDEKYQILKKIGQGAHSTVYKALCKVDNKNYALKKIKNVSFQNWNKMKNLFRMVKLLNHENIIKYTDFHFDEEKRTIFVVMQYCNLKDLRSQMYKRSIEGKSFSEKEILSIAKQLSSVLKYLHVEGICHRDLKPENILYNSQSGEIKVIDLDVCGVKHFKNQSFDLWTNTGTLFYRAPESFGVGYSQKVDIWSMGVIIYELVSGEVPYKTEYEKDFLEKLKSEQPNFQIISSAHKIKILLGKSLEKDPKNRVSAEKLLDQLNLVAKDESTINLVEQDVERRRYFEEADSKQVCLGSLLKFSYS